MYAPGTYQRERLERYKELEISIHLSIVPDASIHASGSIELYVEILESERIGSQQEEERHERELGMLSCIQSNQAYPTHHQAYSLERDST